MNRKEKVTGKRFPVKAAILLMILFIGCTGAGTRSYAASKITLKNGAAAPSSVLVGSVYTLKVSGTAVKFYSSNKKVATIGVTTGKLHPTAPGTVKITAKSKKTGKAVATKTFTVLQRASELNLAESYKELEVGESYKLEAEKVPSASTDVVRFYSSKKSVATVGNSSGKIKAVAPGKATITVYAKKTKATSKSSGTNIKATMEVVVLDGKKLLSANMTGTNTVSVEFAGEPAEMNPSQFVVKSGEKEISVLSVTRGEKEGVYRIRTAEKFTQGEAYELQVTFGETVRTIAVTLPDVWPVEEPELTSVKADKPELTIRQGSSDTVQIIGLDQDDNEFMPSGIVLSVTGISGTASDVDWVQAEDGGILSITPPRNATAGEYRIGVRLTYQDGFAEGSVSLTIREPNEEELAPEKIVLSANQIVLLQGKTAEISFTVYNTLEEEMPELAESKLTISPDYQWIKAGADGKVTITPGAFQEAGNYTFTVGYGDCQSEKITVAILQIVEVDDSYGGEQVPGNDDSYGGEQIPGNDDSYGGEQVPGNDDSYGGEQVPGDEDSYGGEQAPGDGSSYGGELSDDGSFVGDNADALSII